MSSLLRTKRFVWALALAVSTAVMLYAYVAGRRYVDAVRSVEHTLEVSKAIDDVVSTLKDEETGQRGFLLTGDGEFLDAYFAGRRALPAKLAELRRSTIESPRHAARITELEGLAREKQEFIHRTIALEGAGQREQVVALVRSRRGKLIMDRIRALAAAMQAEERALLHERSERAARSQRHTFIAVGFGCAVTLLLLLASFLSVHRDVEAVRRAAEELAESEERFRLLADNASDLVRLHRPDGVHFYVSPSVERLLGYGQREALATGSDALIHPDDLVEFEKLVRSAPERGRGDSVVHRMRHKDGSYRWFDTHVTYAVDAAGRVRHVQTTGRDVTDRRRAEEQLAQHAAELRRLSLRDALTGLYNRRGFLELGGQMLRLAERAQRPLSLVFVDLDGLKTINDELGHELGDAAIREAAEVLAATCRSADLLARLGGDEFVVLAADTDAAAAEALRARIARAVQRRNHEGGFEFVLSFSTGAASLEPGNPESLEDLLARADATMYAHKRARKVARTTSAATSNLEPV